MATLNWLGQFASLQASSATLTFHMGGPPYSFQPSVPASKLDTGPYGSYIQADDGWIEQSSGMAHDRLLEFGFTPRSSNGEDPRSDARTNGWYLSRVTARDNAGRDVWWRESYMDPDRRLTPVGVPTSDRVFSCETFEVSLYDSEYYGVEKVGTLTLKNVVLGGFFRQWNDNPGSMTKYNPCGGQECRAADGVVFCGGDGEELDPGWQGGGGPPHDVLWKAPRSYLEAYDVTVRGVGAPAYSFADLADRPPTYVSDTFGGMIGRSLWNEYFETVQDTMYNREIRFYFSPLVSGSVTTELRRAKTYGYRVNKVQMRTGNGLWVTWEDPNSSVVVRRGMDFHYYSCEQVEFDFPDGSSFRGEFVQIAGYLDVDYSLSKLTKYNPCEYYNLPGTCRIGNGAVYCGGVYVDEGYGPSDSSDDPDGPSGPPQVTPSPAPTAEPTEEGSGANIEWAGGGAYLQAKDVVGALLTGDDYTFAEDYPGVTSTGGDGRYIRHTWSETGYARSMTFQATPLNPQSNSKPRTLSKVTMRDNSDQDLEWVTEDGGPLDNVANRNMMIIPRFFDGFYCDYVEFNFWDTVSPITNPYGYANPPLGTFTARNFTYGNYLGMGGSGPGGAWKLFNPCQELSNPEMYDCVWGEKCRCKMIDAKLTCNGNEVEFDDVYAGMGFPPTSQFGTMGASTAAEDGRRATWTSRLAVAFATAVAVAAGAAWI